MTTADSRRREKRRMDLVGTPAPELAMRIVVDEFSRRLMFDFHAFRAEESDSLDNGCGRSWGFFFEASGISVGRFDPC